VEKKRVVTDRPPARPWTRLDDYVAALARRRTARRRRAERPRSQPDTPRFSLSTLPFLVLIVALFILTAAIMVAAWPGNWPAPRPKVEHHELGVAEKGWLDRAKRDMKR
jgi:hypothetical protein